MKRTIKSKSRLNTNFEKTFFPTWVGFIFNLQTEDRVLLVEIAQIQIGYLSKTKMHQRVFFKNTKPRWRNFVCYFKTMNSKLQCWAKTAFSVFSIEFKPFDFCIME